MKQNFLQDLQEGASCVGDLRAETPTLAFLHMKYVAGQSGIALGRLTLTTVSGFSANTSIFI